MAQLRKERDQRLAPGHERIQQDVFISSMHLSTPRSESVQKDILFGEHIIGVRSTARRLFRNWRLLDPGDERGISLRRLVVTGQGRNFEQLACQRVARIDAALVGATGMGLVA